jgi:hypothetical protein
MHNTSKQALCTSLQRLDLTTMLLLLLRCMVITGNMLRQQHDLASSSSMELPRQHNIQQC